MKEKYPQSSIDFLTIPSSQNIIETNPSVRETIIFDKRGRDKGYRGLKKLGRYLLSKNYDICITPHRSWRSAYLTGKTAASVRIGFDRSAFSRFFTHVQKYSQAEHEILRNLSLLKCLDFAPEIDLPEIFPTDQDKETVDMKLNHISDSKRRRMFAIAPASIWPTKRWPAENFIELIRLLEEDDFALVLIGGPTDKDLCSFIQQSHPNIESFSGEFTLRQTYYFLTLCSGLISNDSAPLHLGLAAGIPVYAIFGATVPEFGFAPFGPRTVILENKNLACRPCGIHGGYKCPTRTFECMQSVSPQLVVSQILQNQGEVHT